MTIRWDPEAVLRQLHLDHLRMRAGVQSRTGDIEGSMGKRPERS